MTSRFRQYEVLERLAVGGMATLDRVRVAAGAHAGQHFVLKRLLPERQEDAAWQRMFRHEIGVTSSLDHENCIAFHDGGTCSGELYLVVDEVRGPHLGQVIGAALRRKQTLPVPLCVDLLRQVALGLSHVHQWSDETTGASWRMLHRDICPQNIMLDAEGRVRLIDFGLAYTVNAPPELANGIVRGRPGYMSPEQCRGEKVDPRSDVFSWGIVAYELFTQKRLFKSDAPDNLLAVNAQAEIEPLRARNDKLPAPVAELVDNALARDPRTRNPNMQEIAAGLLAWLQSQEEMSSSVSLSEWMTAHWHAESEKNEEVMLSSGQAGDET